jgi:hypothetical protein
MFWFYETTGGNCDALIARTSEHRFMVTTDDPEVDPTVPKIGETAVMGLYTEPDDYGGAPVVEATFTYGAVELDVIATRLLMEIEP